MDMEGVGAFGEGREVRIEEYAGGHGLERDRSDLLAVGILEDRLGRVGREGRGGEADRERGKDGDIHLTMEEAQAPRIPSKKPPLLTAD